MADIEPATDEQIAELMAIWGAHGLTPQPQLSLIARIRQEQVQATDAISAASDR